MEHTHKQTSIGTNLRKFTIGDMGFLFLEVFLSYITGCKDGITHVLTRHIFYESRYTRWNLHTLASILRLMDRDCNFYYEHLSFD